MANIRDPVVTGEKNPILGNIIHVIIIHAIINLIEPEETGAFKKKSGIIVESGLGNTKYRYELKRLMRNFLMKELIL